MYNYISGKLVYKEPTLAVIEAGGIGYEIKISIDTSTNIIVNNPTKLYTYLHVQDTAFTLYGFGLPEEKEFFLSLISVAGIGPSMALTFLSSMSISEITDAILKEDVKTIKSIKGVGLKTAQRTILELKGKLPKLNTQPENIQKINQKVKFEEQAIHALMSLGISKSTAEKNIRSAFSKYKNISSIEELIKFALKQN